MARIVIGMSGGVDSAVAAWLLKQQGHEVIGVTLRTWDRESSRCCNVADARLTAQTMDIEYHVINCAADFKRKVEDPFVESYLRGITPNPCVTCNRDIKWEWLIYAANIFHAEAVASGHYVSKVQMDNGRYTLRQARDEKKDQSYMLYCLTQEQLAATIFPLGGLTKQEVRQIADEAGLPSAQNADSQEVCFVSQDNYADFIKEHSPENTLGVGNFVDDTGKILGRHQGIIHYTVGQRKGLGLALGYPAYVKNIRADTKEVVISEEAGIYRDAISCENTKFLSISGLPEGSSLKAMVKIRYHHKGVLALVESCGKDRVLIRFESPARAPAPGQSAVFYDENKCVIGGGIIQQESPSETDTGGIKDANKNSS